jgi:predicted nucleic acid-binding protein
VAALIDTNVLVYRFDPRFPAKQRLATEVLRAGIADGSAFLAHQAIVEFVPAVTRPVAGSGPLLGPNDARREAEELLAQFDVLYPDEELLRIALRGAAAYQLSWFDAHMWAYAERYGLSELLSENFQDDRLYGTVQVVNPFRGADEGSGRAAGEVAAGPASGGEDQRPSPAQGS